MPTFRDWHSIEPYFTFTAPAAVWNAQPTYLAAEGASRLRRCEACLLRPVPHSDQQGSHALAPLLPSHSHLLARDPVMFLILAAWGMRDAARRGAQAPLAFSACLLGGAAVELLTILHGEVGNFYHSQSVLMTLGRREPLYMLFGCYGWIAYATMLSARHFGGGCLAQAAYAALLGSEAWAMLDMMGAQFIWWTWHTSEPLYADREAGIPIASSFWMAASMGGIALALALSRRFQLTNNVSLGLFLGPLGALGFMHGPFMVIYHPIVTFAGKHASVALWSLRALCAAPLLRRGLALPRPDGALLAQWALYLVGMLYTGLTFAPEHEVRHSFSQKCTGGTAEGAVAACATQEGAFWGGFGPSYARDAYVCPARNDPAHDLFRICDARCEPGSATAFAEPTEWYKSCGTPKATGWDELFVAHAVSVLLLALLPFAMTEADADAEEERAQKGKTA